MILFSGTIPKINNSSNTKKLLYSINPPEKVTRFIYHYGDRFLLEPLREMIEPKETYGLITVGRKRATIGYVRGVQVEIIKELTSGMHKDHKAGGQSAPRFQRINREKEKEFYRRIASKISKIFLPMKDFSGFFIGGSGHSKLRFIKQGKLDRQLKSKILNVVDIGYDGGHEGIHALINKIQEKLANVRYVKERRFINEFLGIIAHNPDKVSYGVEETMDLLEKGFLDRILVSELNDRIPEITLKSELKGTKMLIISSLTNEGQMLYDVFGGIVGINRY